MRAHRAVACVVVALLAVASASWSSAQRLPFRTVRIAAPEGDVWVALPAREAPPRSLGVVVALHGLGEARRGPQRGARGWLLDYELFAMWGGLTRGRVPRGPLREWVTREQVTMIERELRRHPASNIAIVMPYTWPLIEQVPGSPRVREFEAWLDGALARVRAELPELSDVPARTVIDGVSLGGFLALDIGLRRPDRYGSVGALQPAIRRSQPQFEQVAVPGSVRCLRLASSRGDPFLTPTRAVSAAWTARGIRHELVVTGGPHDYAYNRGPGALELVRFGARCTALQSLGADLE